MATYLLTHGAVVPGIVLLVILGGALAASYRWRLQ